MNTFFVIYSTLVISLFQEIVAVDECSFSLEYDSPKTPLILENSSNLKPIYPKDGVIHLSKNDTLYLSCLDKKFKYSKAKHLEVTCVQDDIVLVQNRQMHFKDLECRAYPTSIIRKRQESCAGNNVFYDIGFVVGGEFRFIMGVCYNPNEARTVYAYYNYTHLNDSNPAFESFKKIAFRDDDLYNFNIAEMYSQENQIKQFGDLLESRIQAVRFLRSENNTSLKNQALVSGSLIPTSYFVYGYEKSATFHYLNTAPQWNVIKTGNWKKVEKKVRKLLIAKGNRLAIMSGTHGVAVLPNPENEEKELFLYKDEKNQRYLPVPKFFYKLIYDKEMKKGVAVVGINNPHLQSIPANYYLCENICHDLKWFNMKKNDISKGYVYCCEMEAFLKATAIENIFSEKVAKRDLSTVEQSADDCNDLWLGIFC